LYLSGIGKEKEYYPQIKTDDSDAQKEIRI